MIFIGILDTAGLGKNPSLASSLSSAEQKRIEKIKNKEEKNLKTGSRLLLKELYESCFDEKMPEIFYTEYGKPCFLNKKISFSVSHNNSLAAVAINEGGEDVGIDIQSLSESPARIDRVYKRFFKDIDENLLFNSKESAFSGEIKWKFFEICENGIKEASQNKGIALLSEEEKTENNDFFVIKEFSHDPYSSFFEKWTSLEAVLKLYGKGFRDFIYVNECLQKSVLKSWFFQYGSGEWAISLAIKKEEI